LADPNRPSGSAIDELRRPGRLAFIGIITVAVGESGQSEHLGSRVYTMIDAMFLGFSWSASSSRNGLLSGLQYLALLRRGMHCY